MKFGHEVFKKMVPEWRAAYVDYNLLKTLLKPLKLLSLKYRSIPLPSLKNRNQLVITNFRKDEIDSLEKFIQDFDIILNREFEKITKFFRGKMIEYLKKYRLLKINMVILDSMSLDQDVHIPKTQIRNAFHSFYKEIILLNHFYTINYEAIRKILKKEKKLIENFPIKLRITPQKFEDLFQDEAFYQENVPNLDTLKQDLEHSYLDKFYGIGEKEVGRIQLNKITQGRFTSHLENFQNGMFLGFSILLLSLIFILSINARMDPDEDEDFFYVFHVFRSFALVLVYQWILCWNVYGWSDHYVNYKIILGFNHHYSTLSEVIYRTSVFTSLLLLSFLCYILVRQDAGFRDFFFWMPHCVWAILPWIAFIFYLFFPSTKYFNGEGRLYFFHTLRRMFFSLEFAPIWATEQCLSFMIPFRDLIFSFAFYIGKIYYFFNPTANHDPAIIDPDEEDENNTLQLPSMLNKIIRNITSSDFINKTEVMGTLSHRANESNRTSVEIDNDSPIIISVQTFLILTLFFTIFPISLRLLQSIRQFLKIRKRSELINSFRYILVALTILFSFLFALEVGGGWEEMRLSKNQKSNEPSSIEGRIGSQINGWSPLETTLNFGGYIRGDFLENSKNSRKKREWDGMDMGKFTQEWRNESRKVGNDLKILRENLMEGVVDGRGDGFFWWWVGMAIMSTIVSYAWDLKVEWGFLEKKAKHRYLREQLSYNRPMFYYLAIFINIFLRFCWIITLSPGILFLLLRRQSFTFIFGMLEMLRRGIWNFFRIEMEHIANCGDFKVVEEFKLPFENFQYNFDEKRIFAGDIPRTRSRPPSIPSRTPPPPSSSQSPPSSLLPPSSSIKKPLLSSIREEDGGGGKEEGWRRNDEDDRKNEEQESEEEEMRKRKDRKDGEKQEDQKGNEWGWEEEEIDKVRREVKEFRRRIHENNWFYVVEQGKGEERDEERKIN